jgi:hypothetical protein
MEDETLDMNWINQEEKKISMNYGFIREPMKKIRMNFVYVHQNSVNSVHTEDYVLMDEDIVTDDVETPQVIPNVNIIQLIESHKNIEENKYKLNDLLLFNVTLESEEIQKYILGEEMYNSKFLKSIPVVQNIVIEPSIFIFHKTNAIYFIFKEIERTKWLRTAITNKLRPILKNAKDMRKTKKRVQIDLDSNITID